MNLRLLPLLCLPLIAIAQTEPSIYTCDNGSRLEIAFSAASDETPHATLRLADESITLPQVPVAAGSLYRKQGIILATKDDDAIFEDGKGNRRRCTRGENAPAPIVSERATVVSSFLDITGSIAYRARIALPPGAVLTILVKSGNRTLAEQRIELTGQQVPIPFQTTIDRDLIAKKGKVSITARIQHSGKTLFVTDKPWPALANGQAVHQDIELKQAPQKKNH